MRERDRGRKSVNTRGGVGGAERVRATARERKRESARERERERETGRFDG
jgi:hypothetical protein